ncbi:MAG: thioredoxin domain-containing protein [Anaerolineae bacterium]
MTTAQKQKAKNTDPAAPRVSAKERREQERRRQQRQQTILLTVVGVALLVVVVGAILLTVFAPVEATVGDEFKSTYASILAKGENYQGTTAEGYYYVGNPDAPVVLEEFSSFSCPHCKDYHDQVLENIHDKIESGQVKLIYMPLTNFGPFDSTNMTKAAMCAGQQGKFWQMHDLMFDWQSRYGTGANDARRLSAGAAALGLDQGTFDSCFNGSSLNDTLKKSAEEAAKRGVAGTPTLYLNGQKMESGGGIIGLNELRGVIESLAKT